MPDQWLKLGFKLKVTADSDGEELSFLRDVVLNRTQLANYIVVSGHIDMTSSESGTTLPMGPIMSTGHIFYFETDADDIGFTLGNGALDGVLIPVRTRVSGQNGFALLMTTFDVATATSAANAGRVTYCMIGVA